MRSTKITLYILIISKITIQTETILESQIDEDLSFDMLQACLLAYPDPSEINKREVCLLHIDDYYSTINIYNTKNKVYTDNVYLLDIANACMELNTGTNGSEPSREACNEDSRYLSQRWIFEIEGSYMRIRNTKYNKCLFFSGDVVSGETLKVQDCVVGNTDQLFNFAGSLFLNIVHHSGLCVLYDLGGNPGYFQAAICGGSSNYNYMIKNVYGIYNPFFKKSIEITTTMPKVMNSNKSEFQRFLLLSRDPFQNEYFLLNFTLNLGLKSTGTVNLTSDTMDLTIIGQFTLEFIKPKLFQIKSSNTSNCISMDDFENEENGLLYMKNCAIEKGQLWQFIDF